MPSTCTWLFDWMRWNENVSFINWLIAPSFAWFDRCWGHGSSTEHQAGTIFGSHEQRTKVSQSISGLGPYFKHHPDYHFIDSRYSPTRTIDLTFIAIVAGGPFSTSSPQTIRTQLLLLFGAQKFLVGLCVSLNIITRIEGGNRLMFNEHKMRLVQIGRFNTS